MIPLFAEIISDLFGSIVFVFPTEKEAGNSFSELESLSARPTHLFPGWGVAPYKDISPLNSVFCDRALILSKIMDSEKSVLFTSHRALMGILPDPSFFKSCQRTIKKGDELSLGDLAEFLVSLGYLRVPRVSLRGEFALRGEVIDIFIPGNSYACRIVSQYDEVEHIKSFDPYSQASIDELESLTLFPLREVLFTPDRLEILGENLKSTGVSPEAIKQLLNNLGETSEAPGSETYFPLCFEQKHSLFDYLPQDTMVVMVEPQRIKQTQSAVHKEYETLYYKLKKDDPLLPKPKDLIWDESIITHYPKQLWLSPLSEEHSSNSHSIHFKAEAGRSFFGNFSFLKEEIANLISVGYHISVCASSEPQAQRLSAILKDFNIEIFTEGLASGFSIPDIKEMVISENEIFGRKKRMPKALKTARSKPIDSFVDLEVGDYVVHINYGIGLYRGIERIKTSYTERDYIHLEYADAEMIYIPIEQVNLIQRYIAQEGKSAKLDKIGGKSWEGRKQKVKKSVEDLADMLVALYAEREKTSGFAYEEDTDWQKEFEAGFPYEETEDQLRCIDEVKRDMESARPMDRLVCGDVGYGKTEIALRAAFKAVMGGRQVAILAPTTILVEQHFENFCARMEKFPINIAMLSRFKNKAEIREILKKTESGDIDIVIGTHRLVQKDVKFKRLGLLVIDEEQRFGVKHKERLKELKTNVDCLTLSATPIPRTLHMSLMKIRDMSILSTPPQNRLPIETFIEEFDEEIIAKAIRREVERGGQVFYLHNRVETLPQTHAFLSALVPEYAVDIGHGQMSGHDLEDVMHRFIHGQFDILLSTTIIENGLDIPNVNTIIIDRADMFGISQLYQLRGRVGRSGTAAYAYLLYPKARNLTEIAMKRLRIISDYTELGSGFKVALKDLEIRGAGNLLGREQSGDILAVGFDMYLKLLDEAIRERGNDKTPRIEDVYLELEYSGFIPDSYICDSMEKMEVYKRIASVASREECDRLYSEIADRFGPIPDEVASIFSISEIRIICQELYIATLKERSGLVTIEFSQLSHISVDKVLRLIRESGGRVYLDNNRPQCLFMKIQNIGLKEKSEYIRDLLSRIV
ncbi:MAG: transcription-repair coupling factor [Spirochaetales bacterium]|nr:transcription-repair coupling factor [Spirochaetales bacterium]